MLNQEKREASPTSWWIVALAVLIPFVVLFGHALWSGDLFGYRDAANYYLPSFQWELDQWRAGRIPLWNPHDNLGTPYVADATSSVFYPGKLVLAIPMDYIRRFNLYVAVHVLLAVANCYFLARRLRLGIEASGFAAVSYAFGANVVFQYANVVYLVGASWMPLGFLASHEMLHRQSVPWAVALGAVLALMTLGGDPQAAYHTVLLAALYALVRRFSGKRADRQDEPEPQRMGRFSIPLWSPALLAIACCSGFCLAAVQILPSMEWTRHSARAAFHEPRSLVEAGTFLLETRSERAGGDSTNRMAMVGHGLFGQPAWGSHQEHIYHFSVGPWRFGELLWPNCTGRNFPTNHRWITLLPGEGRVWTPSLYVGLLPFLLAIAGWRVRRTNATVRWLSCCTAVAFLASLGWYGLGWGLHEIRVGVGGTNPNDVIVGQPVGGLYWLLVCCLPGYVYFRYPAKWLVVASLGISLLGARQLQSQDLYASRAVPRAILVLSWISLLGALLLTLGGQRLAASIAEAPVDAVFGPLDVAAGIGDACGGLLHTGIIGLLAYIAFRRWCRKAPRRWQRFALILTSIELAAANGWFTATVPHSVWQETPRAEQAIRQYQQTDPSAEHSRLFRASPFTWVPHVWSDHCDERRLDQVVSWERNTLLPKHHLPSHISLVESFSSISSRDCQALFRVARRHGPSDGTGQSNPHPSVLSTLSCRFLLEPDESDSVDFASLRFHARAFPRVWIVHDVQVVPPCESHDPAQLERHLEAIFFPGHQPRDLRRTAVVEGPAVPRVEPATREEECRLVDYQPNRVVCDVTLSAPGLLVLNDLHYPGWQAFRKDIGSEQESPVRLIRANGVMRAVALPAGRHRVRFGYVPTSFQVGVTVSSLAWLALVSVIAWRWRRRGRTP